MELEDKTVDVLFASPTKEGVGATDYYLSWYKAEIGTPYYYPTRPDFTNPGYEPIREICKWIMRTIPDYKDNIVWQVTYVAKFRFRRERDYMLFLLAWK